MTLAFISFKTRAGDFIKQHSAWTFWTTNCFGLEAWLRFCPPLKPFVLSLYDLLAVSPREGFPAWICSLASNVSPMHENLLRPLARQYDSHSKDTLSPAVRKYFDFKAGSLGLHKENIFVQEFTSKYGQCTRLSPSRTNARSLKQATDGSESKNTTYFQGWICCCWFYGASIDDRQSTL